MSDSTASHSRLIGRFAAGEDVRVPFDEVDERLDQMWRDLAKRRNDGRVVPVFRACLLNLIVHSTDDESEVIARYLAGALADQLPARVILLRARPDSPTTAEPSAWVSTITEPGGTGDQRRVSGELVVLEARGATVNRLPPLVRALLERDMEAAVWWTGELPRDLRYVRELRDLADRVLVDSDKLPDDDDTQHLLPRSIGVRLSDIAWPRQVPWRRAISHAFDAAAHRQFLDDLAVVRIGVRVDRTARSTSGPLLAGWLAASLDWRRCEAAGERAVGFETQSGKPRLIEFERRPGGGGGVVDVEMIDADGECLSFRRIADPDRVEARTPPSFRRVRPALWEEPTEQEVLAASLLDITADPIAPRAIRAAAQISAKLGAREA